MWIICVAVCGQELTPIQGEQRKKVFFKKKMDHPHLRPVVSCLHIDVHIWLQLNINNPITLCWNLYYGVI